jgi:hypothetical protein
MYSFDIRRRTSISLSTTVSSNTCLRNLALRSILPHCGHGAGPRAKILSIHVSQLQLVSPVEGRGVQFMIAFRVDEQLEVRFEVFVCLAYGTEVIEGGLCDDHSLALRSTNAPTSLGDDGDDGDEARSFCGTFFLGFLTTKFSCLQSNSESIDVR